MAEEAAEGKKKGGLLKYIMCGLGGLALVGLGLGAGYFVFGSGSLGIKLDFHVFLYVINESLVSWVLYQL